MTRRWTINGDFFGLSPEGVARYAIETALALDRLVGERHPITQGLQLDIIAPRSRPDLAFANLPVTVLPEWQRPRLPQVWCQLQLPRHVAGGLLSFCNLAPVGLARHIVCIHDLHTRRLPQNYSRGFRLAHRVILPLLGRRAAAVTTGSELSRSELAAYAVVPAAKVTVANNGADHARAWDDTASTFKSPHGRPFVFGLARPQPYKNTALFWRIAPALDALGLDIVLAGGFDPATAASYGPKPANLHLLGRVCDGDLARAMRTALCFVFPSRMEGFGLPAVEAMINGCPVVASTAKALVEVCGDAALLADPEKPDQWIAAIERLRNSDALRQAMIGRGRARADHFTWRRTAEIYLGLMLDVDKAFDTKSRASR